MTLRRLPAFLFLAIVLLAANAAFAVSPNIVISQIYGGAGCATAGCSTYKNDYIELFNRGASAQSVNGWSVQYAAATGTAWQVTNLPNVSIPAGGYLLVAEASSATGVNNLPAPIDATGTISMSATAAKIALVNATTALTGRCGNGATLTIPAAAVDFVGYGTTADCNAAGPATGGVGNAPAPSTTNAIFRAANGCTDTDVDSSNFTAAAAAPRNSGTTPAPCGPVLPNLTINDVPLNEGNAGTTSFTFTVSLSAPAGPGGVTFDIATADGTATQPGDYTQKSLTGQTIPAGSSTYSFTVLGNGDTTPETNETFFVNVTNVTGANVTDGQGQGTIVNDDSAPNLTINDVTLAEGNAGTTTFTFTVSLSAPAPAGGVTFDIATANSSAVAPGDYTAKSLTSQTIPAGSSTYTFDVLVNGDITPEANETFFVNVTNITNAIGTDTQGLGTINNDDLSKIHDVQGNGSATPVPGSTVTVEGIVVGDYQASTQLSGFFLQEEDADVDADPNTSEGIFIFCSACPTAVAEGQKVQVTGTVSEFNNMTEITASTAPSVVVTNAGNNLAQVTPSPIDLPVIGVVNDFYEAREGMLVTFIDTLSISEYFELFRFGQIELFEGGRPRQYTEFNAPSAAGYAAYLASLDRRRVILDDDDNQQNVPLTLPDGSQFVFHPRANGGFSVGTQGTDFFRGGDVVNGLTGVLHWSFPGVAPDTWRIRPMSATASSFTVNNPRPATAPAVGGAIKALSMNMLNYFTTIDTTSSSSSGPCGPSGTQDCRGADSAAELNRQRERASIVICGLNPDVAGLMEMENNAVFATPINDLLGAVNARCGGANPYAFVNTGGSLGTDAIRNFIIYRTNVLSPVGSPLVDLDPVHNRPPTAQTFDVVNPTNPAFGKRFTIIANHFKSKGCPGSGADADAGDGQSCFNGTRKAQATRLLTWINATVLPAAGDPDVILVGDFNSYAQEDPVTTIEAGGYTDTETALLGANAYSYLFDGQLGHLDYAFTSASLTPQVTGVGAWHINADEVPLFDYNDEVLDTGEQAFEEKPDGSALVPPRVVFQPSSPYRASDHDPVLLGIFAVSDLVLTKTDSPDPVNAGNNLTYGITVTNNGPDAASSASWSDTLPAGTTFVSMPNVAGWSCTTPAVGSGGTVSCTNPSFAVGTSIFTLTVNVAASVANGTVLSNTATVTSTSEGNPGDESDTETTTVTASADLQLSKTDSPDPVTAGSNLSYQLTLTNNGPSNAASATFSDTLPAGTTFVSLSTTGPWSCTTPAVGATGTVSCTNTSFGVTVDFFTLVVKVDANVAGGTVLSNTATLGSATTDPNGANNSDTATTTVAASADLQLSKTDSPDPVTAGSNVSYQLTLTNNGLSNAASATFSDTLPAGTTFVSLSTTGSWSCTTPAVGSTGTVSCTNTSFGVTVDFFTLVVKVDANVAAGTVLSNTATLGSATTDPNGANNSATATTTVATSADLQISKTDSPDPVTAGTNLTYQLTLTNNGPSNAANATFSDTLPTDTTFVSLSTTGSWSCTTPGVNSTGTVSCTNTSFGPTVDFFTLVVMAAPNTPAGTVLTNTATLSSSTTDPNGGNNSDTATTTVATSADMQITKVDTPDPVTAGNNITYTINIANPGPSAAAGVVFTDNVPANTTFVSLTTFADFNCTTPAVGGTGAISCTKGSLFVNGSSGNFTLVVKVDPGTASGAVITNTANIATTTTDPNGANNSATATTTVGVGSAEVSITKTDSPDPVVAGTNLTYTITVANAGPTNATSVSWSDTLPTGTTFVSLAQPGGWSCTTPGVGGTGAVTCSIASLGIASAPFTLVIAVDPALASGTVLTNTANVTSATTDPNPGNESATTTTTVNASADVQVAKIDTPDPVTPGTNVTYTITVTNAGPSNATALTLSDTVPTGTTFVSLTSPAGWACTAPAAGATGAISCTAATLAAGANAVFTLVVNANPSLTNGTVITNTANVATTTTDPNGANNSATATTTVGVGSANLSITKTDSPDPVNAGANLTYTITVNNAGPTNAASVSLSDTLPANTTFVSMTAPAGWNCVNPAVGATGTVTCTNPNVATGSNVFTLVVKVANVIAPGSTISNTATVSSTTADPNTGNESATSTTTVASPANVSGTKTVTGTFVPSGSVTYTITLANSGPSTQQDNAGNEFIDVLPSTLTLVSATANSGTAVATVGTNTVTWNGSIPAASSVTITINATIKSNVAPGTTINNQGTINYDADGNGTNESTRQTDSPSAPGSADATGFVVAAATVEAIPTLDEMALMALAVMLAMVAAFVLKK